MAMTPEINENIPPYEEHIGDSRQYWRDIILGVNDGLLSMVLLVAGVVGGGLTADQVLLTGIAGAIAGAVSMAAGEFLATKSQDDVLAAEIALEKVHLKYHRQMELDQLKDMFTDMGLLEKDLSQVVAAFDRSDEAMLNAMKALEFGVVDSERRSPYTAMTMSGLLFLAGASTSVVPFMFTESTTVGLWWAAALTAAGLYLVGVVKSIVTRTSSFRAGIENMSIAGVGGILAWWVGKIVDSNIT
jgi:VIT1/CCC1 family predicted Fe2+/Mn2+ transporter